MSRGPISVRGYGLTPWARAFVDVVEGRDAAAGSGPVADSTHIAKARRYFRDRHVHRLTIAEGRVTASVEGTQLDPFDVIVTTRPVHADTVAALLRARGAVEELMSLTRGEQPAILGELVLPSGSAEVTTHCTCPDEAARCVHCLAVAYEVAAEIDRSPLTLLRLMGTDLKSLSAAVAGPQSAAQPGSDTGEPLPTVDFYGTSTALPPLPSPSRMNPLTDLDGSELRAALRATGVSTGDIAETIDELGDLYDRITET